MSESPGDEEETWVSEGPDSAVIEPARPPSSPGVPAKTLLGVGDSSRITVERMAEKRPADRRPAAERAAERRAATASPADLAAATQATVDVGGIVPDDEIGPAVALGATLPPEPIPSLKNHLGPDPALVGASRRAPAISTGFQPIAGGPRRDVGLIVVWILALFAVAGAVVFWLLF